MKQCGARERSDDEKNLGDDELAPEIVKSRDTQRSDRQNDKHDADGESYARIGNHSEYLISRREVQSSAKIVDNFIRSGLLDKRCARGV